MVVGPSSPIVISPTPSPEDREGGPGLGAHTHPNQPQLVSWRHKQDEKKRELVSKLRETLFQFCQENLEYSKCLHIKGDVLVIFDDDTLSAEFDKHIHCDEVNKDKSLRSQHEAAAATAQRLQLERKRQQQQLVQKQPIITSVASLAGMAPGSALSGMGFSGAREATGSKRVSGLDRILNSWHSNNNSNSSSSAGSNNSSSNRPEEHSPDSDTEYLGELPSGLNPFSRNPWSCTLGIRSVNLCHRFDRVWI